MIRVNKAVRDRRAWSKFGDCDGQEHGFKETGVVNIAEPVMFELAGQEENKDAQQAGTKGVGNLLNMDTFSALRHLRNRVSRCLLLRLVACVRMSRWSTMTLRTNRTEMTPMHTWQWRDYRSGVPSREDEIAWQVCTRRRRAYRRRRVKGR